MGLSTLAPIVLILALPAFAIQLRLVFYKKGKSREALRANVLEVIPHDLSLIGLTLGIVAQTMALSNLPLHDALVSRLALLYVSFVPFLIAAVLPIVTHRAVRIALGMVAYIVGALCYVYVLIEFGGL